MLGATLRPCCVDKETHHDWHPADEVKVPFGYDYVLQGCEAFLKN